MELKLQQLLRLQSLSAGERILIYLTATFLALAIIAIVSIFVSRLQKASKEKEASRLRNIFRNALNMIVVMQPSDEAKASSQASMSYRMQELKLAITKGDLAKQLLIDEIIHLKKNLTGQAVDVLQRVYYNLALETFSRSKLRSIKWEERAKGIREIAEMDDIDMLPDVQSLLNSSNVILRTEAMVASIRLNREKPFSFLHAYPEKITPWVTINLFKHISALPQQRIPDFSLWLNESNDSVVMFSLKVVRQLRQTRAVGKIISLLKHGDPEVVSEALLTLGDLEAYDMLENLLEQKESFRTNAQVALSFMMTLEKIGEGPEAISVANEFVSHPSYEVRFQAMKVMRRLGQNPELSNEADRRIVEHLNEPLLQ
jgi:hypothetical protein